MSGYLVVAIFGATGVNQASETPRLCSWPTDAAFCSLRRPTNISIGRHKRDLKREETKTNCKIKQMLFVCCTLLLHSDGCVGRYVGVGVGVCVWLCVCVTMFRVT